MSVLPQRIAKMVNKHPRTIRRWCELGIIAGAYRTKGGHWRIRRFRLREQVKLLERLKTFARVRAPRPKGSRPFLDKDVLEWLKSGGWKMHLKATRLLLATQGLSEATSLVENMTVEQSQILDHTPLHRAITPRIYEAAQNPRAKLRVAAQMILTRSPSGKELNASSLARELGISRMTLYRKYGQSELRDVLDSFLRQARDLPSEKVATGLKRTNHRDNDAPLRRKKKRR